MSDSVTLWGDQFAPVTSAIGFLQAPLEVVADGLTQWRRRIHGSAQAEWLPGGLRNHVTALEPLTSRVQPRELVVATADPGWTALFDCGFPVGDPDSTTGYLAETLKVQGVTVRSVPASGGRNAPFGARQLDLFAPIPTDYLNFVRSISVTEDEGRWRFDTRGTVQDFEDLDAYQRRRIAERFTPQMLVDYAAALGLRPFDGDFYPGPSVLVRNPAVPPPGALVLSISEAQAREGIVPTA